MQQPRRVRGPTLPRIEVVPPANLNDGAAAFVQAEREVQTAIAAAVQIPTAMLRRRAAPPCNWPEENLGSGKGWRFCCQDAVHGLPYCAEHDAIAHGRRPPIAAA